MSIGLLVNVAIAVTLIELVALIVYASKGERGMPAREVLPFLGAGLCLLLAMRSLTAAASEMFVAAMLLSLVFHLWHVKQRWR